MKMDRLEEIEQAYKDYYDGYNECLSAKEIEWLIEEVRRLRAKAGETEGL